MSRHARTSLITSNATRKINPGMGIVQEYPTRFSQIRVIIGKKLLPAATSPSERKELVLELKQKRVS
jgi:hypothetical protein